MLPATVDAIPNASEAQPRPAESLGLDSLLATDLTGQAVFINYPGFHDQIQMRRRI